MRSASLRIYGSNEAIPLLGDGPWLLGCSDHCDIRVEDPASDDEQARIFTDEDGFFLEPCSRTVPTLLNQAVVAGAIDLHDGDSIAFGRCRMVFVPAVVRRGGDARTGGARISLGPSTRIGQPGADVEVPLDHPNVSRQHALIERDDRTARVTDLGTDHGTFVNGARVRSAPLVIGDVIDIGPFSFRFVGDALERRHRSGDSDLLVAGVSRDVPHDGGSRRILNDVSLHIRPRELVCIVGTSGSGKSTLMNIVSGRAAPTAGTVMLDGRDLHRNFEALKSDIAFVPQQDVLHEPLKLGEALDYAARLRLPEDVTAERRSAVVAEVARSVELPDKLDTVIASLSGGQKKRASLASELLAKPGLLFLDEVTSGLDEATDREIMALLRRMADQGTTIVCVTHTLANIETFAHRIVVMAAGGVLTFSGSPAEALAFFGVQRLGEIFERIDAEGPVNWADEYRANHTAPAARAAPAGAPPPAERLGAAQALRQFAVLNSRNARLLVRDVRMLVLAGAQTALIGILVGYVFSDISDSASTESQRALIRLLAMVSIWLGCNSAATQIVSELPIFRRERDINLSVSSFVLSKFVVTSIFALAQLLGVLLLVTLLAEGIPGGALGQLPALALSTLAGTGLGLTISALSNSRDQASTIVPLAIVPQMTLGIGIVPVLPDFATALRDITISAYWTIEAMNARFIGADGPVTTFLPDIGRLGELTSEPASKALVILGVHAALLLAITYAIVRVRFGGDRR